MQNQKPTSTYVTVRGKGEKSETVTVYGSSVAKIVASVRRLLGVKK